MEIARLDHLIYSSIMRSKDGSSTFTETARRAQIVEYAIEAIAELGYHQASVRKIAERVGVSQMNVSRLLAKALARLRDQLE